MTRNSTNSGETPLGGTSRPVPQRTILVVDDEAMVREPIVAVLESEGYRGLHASNGKEGLRLLADEAPDLVLLDMEMPEMDGVAFLRELRLGPRGATPVILLSIVADRSRIGEVLKLGVQGYMLKSAFSMKRLRTTLREQFDPHRGVSSTGEGAKHAAWGQPPPAQTAPSKVVPTQVVPTKVDPAKVDPTLPIPRLLTRDQCLDRARAAMEAKTLSGVVMQVISQAASPQSDMAHVATLIGRDPMLSAKILRIANSPNYASGKAVVTTIPEAVRKVGLSAVRNAAAALGIFEAMPETGPDGFNPIRCWQHSFAVARLCEMLIEPVQPDSTGLAYVVGLCHDLGEIFFYTQFAAELRQLLDLNRRTGRPVEQLEREMLGMTRNELVVQLLRMIGLPETIRHPIEAFHKNVQRHGDPGTARLTRILQLANVYAQGLLLASGETAFVSSFTRAECRAAAGNDHPPRPDTGLFRGEILSLTGTLARLSRDDEAALMSPLLKPAPHTMWLARDPAFSQYDPVQAALESLAAVEVHDRLPKMSQEWGGLQSLGVAAASPTTPGFTPAEIARAAGLRPAKPASVLWLVAQMDTAPASGLVPRSLPVTLQTLADFVATP